MSSEIGSRNSDIYEGSNDNDAPTSSSCTLDPSFLEEDDRYAEKAEDGLLDHDDNLTTFESPGLAELEQSHLLDNNMKVSCMNEDMCTVSLKPSTCSEELATEDAFSGPNLPAPSSSTPISLDETDTIVLSTTPLNMPKPPSLADNIHHDNISTKAEDEPRKDEWSSSRLRARENTTRDEASTQSLPAPSSKFSTPSSMLAFDNGQLSDDAENGSLSPHKKVEKSRYTSNSSKWDHIVIEEDEAELEVLVTKSKPPRSTRKAKRARSEDESLSPIRISKRSRIFDDFLNRMLESNGKGSQVVENPGELTGLSNESAEQRTGGSLEYDSSVVPV